MLAEMAHVKTRQPFGMPGDGVLQTHKNFGSINTNSSSVGDRYQQSEARRPKKIVFFCNGNRYFKGKKLYITPHRYVTFNDLLSDLTGKLPSSSSLPYGVRQIYTPSGGRKIRDVDELQDGKSYVCAGFETFKTLKYGEVDMEPWATGRSSQRHGELPQLEAKLLSGFSAVFGKSTYQPAAAAAHHKQLLPHLEAYMSPRAAAAAEDRLAQALTSNAGQGGSRAPAMVTVVRVGIKPYSVVKLLLNKASVQSYETLLSDVSEAFGPKWKHNRVRRLYALSGREVLSLSDFFRGDGVFVAVGNEKATLADIQDIIEELFDGGGGGAGGAGGSQSKPVLPVLARRKKRSKQRRTDLGSVDEELLPTTDRRLPPLPPQPGEQAEDAAVSAATGGQHHHHHRSAAQDEGTGHRLPLQQVQVASDKAAAHNLEMKEPRKPQLRVKPSPREAAAALISKLNEPPEPTARLVLSERAPLPSIQPDLSKESREPAAAAAADEPAATAADSAAVDSLQKSKARQLQEKRAQEERIRQNLYRSLEAKLKGDGPVSDDEGAGSSDAGAVENGIRATAAVSADVVAPKPVPRRREKPREPRLAKAKADRQTTVESVLDSYEIGRTLGDGNFALVKACVSRQNGAEYAMKVIDKGKLKGKEAMLENEITIMKACNDQHLVKLIDEFETADEIYLVLELVKGGDLFDAISQSVKFDEGTAAGMTRDITLALFYLHSRNIVHRDLKPENVMVMRNTDGSISLKLGDFGLAVEVLQTLYTICGTPTYVAPEILSEVGYGLEIDMWALGVITYILLCGFPPFRSPQRNQSELFEYIKAGQYEFLSPYWDSVSSGAKDLVQRLLVVDRKKRYTAIDVLCHPWILTNGGTVHLPHPIEQHSNNTRNRLLTKAADNMAEWQSHRDKIFSHLT